jgi:hypothetical protein
MSLERQRRPLRQVRRRSGLARSGRRGRRCSPEAEMHYDIYRRYPLPWFPALRNAWRACNMPLKRPWLPSVRRRQDRRIARSRP